MALYLFGLVLITILNYNLYKSFYDNEASFDVAIGLAVIWPLYLPVYIFLFIFETLAGV